jgi:hypothetical protein
MQPMSNMLTVNHRKSQKMEMMRKIEMSNMLIEKERKKERNETIEKNSVCCNEEIMQPMSNKLIDIL